jgi:acyl-CoA thioesterase
VTRDTEGYFALGELLDLRMEMPEAGRAVARISTTERHHNPHGTVHGAVLFAMVDTAMGAATMSVLDEGHLCASIDVHLRFLAPVFGGELHASAEVLRSGRRVVHLESRVHDAEGTLVATATGAFAVLAPPA